MLLATKIHEAHRPRHASVLTSLTTTGAYTYTVPIWCDRVDIVLIGGGRGGANPGLGAGTGGKNAVWASTTMVRGTGIPWTTTSITGTVGTGGASNNGNGANSTATATGMTTQTGAGSTTAQASGQNGGAPGNVVLNGHTYTGGIAGTGNGGAGGAPGAGGAGGNFLGANGGAGGAGAVFILAYQNNFP